MYLFFGTFVYFSLFFIFLIFSYCNCLHFQQSILLFTPKTSVLCSFSLLNVFFTFLSKTHYFRLLFLCLLVHFAQHLYFKKQAVFLQPASFKAFHVTVTLPVSDYVNFLFSNSNNIFVSYFCFPVFSDTVPDKS